MTKENLWQIIIGMMVTAISGVILNMAVFSFFPALIVAIAWAGYKQTSGKEYKDKSVQLRGNRSSGKTLYL